MTTEGNHPNPQPNNFEACFEAKKDFNAKHGKVLKMSFQFIMSSGNGWTNESMTDETLAAFANVCEANQGRFTASELAILDCGSSSTKIAYHNIGDCFPMYPSSVCAEYTLGTFVTDLSNQKMHTQCTLRTETLRTHLPSPAAEDPETLSTSPTPLVTAPQDEIDHHSDEQRFACQQSINEYFMENTAFQQANEEYFYAQVMAEDAHWWNTTVSATASATYRNACETAGGRFATYTGVLDCIGFGNYHKKRIGKKYVNYGQCFAPTPSCEEYYTEEQAGAETWWIDFNWVWEYDCKVIQKEETVVAAVPVPSATTDVPSNDDATDNNYTMAPLFVLCTITATCLIAILVLLARQRRRKNNDYRYTYNELDLEMTSRNSLT
jgi:hypothetical protein